jgi:NADPH oxidase
MLDASFFHILLEPLLPIFQAVMAVIYSTRWELSRPLQIRVFPSWFPFIDYPGIKDLPFLTIGQILLAIPLLILILSGYYFTIVSPDVETSGTVASFAIFATFLTANKSNSITAFLLGIPFERMIPYHNLSSLTTVILSLFHGYVAFAYGEGDRRKLDSKDSQSGDDQYGLTGSNPNLLKFLFDGDNNTSGALLALSMIALVLSSIFPIFRRKFFDFWLWTHILLALCVIIFCIMHEVTSIIFIALWWLLDILMRYLILAGCRYPHKARLELITDDIVKVSFTKPDGFQYNAGQFVQIAFPDLGLFAFHPISISSSPHESLVTLHVRGLGNWSKRLIELSKVKGEVPILLEGPYGSISMDLDDDNRYQMALLVSGGIGVTHTQSVAKSLLNDHSNGRKLKHLRFVWALRDLDMLQAMTPLEAPSTHVDIELMETSEFQTEVMNLSSQLSMLDNTPQQQLVETDIFLTKASPDVPVTMDDGRNIYFGRPDLDAIVADVKEEAKKLGVTHVAVFGCGPKALVDKLKDACRQQSQIMSKVKFDVHEEIFDF